MGRLLDSLVAGEPVRTVQEGDGGLNLYPIDGHQSEFDALARKLMDKLGPDYVAFPRSSGQHHYDHVLVLRLDG